MADKLSWTELRRALAQRASVNEKTAGTFLNELQKQIIEALKQDKLVKINGLGTFKLQAVAPRKSVNVKTGEQIVIEGYNKVVFVPEAGVKELVEKAGELGETAEALHLTEEKEAVDPIKKLGAQAEEIVDILGELGQSPKDEEEKKEEEKPQKPVEKKKPAPRKKKVEQPTEEPKQPVEEPKQPVEEPKQPVVPKEPEEPEAPKAKKPYHFVRDTLICVVILLLLLLVGYFFLRNQLSGWIEELVQPKEQTEQVEPVTVIPESPEVTEVPETPVAQEPVLEETPAVEPVAEVAEWHYDKLIKTEEITPGSRLAWISKKYYGSIVYWPYLYAANKDRLDNPSNIAVGTPIRVPKLTAADKDTTTAQFKQLKQEAEAALR